MLMDKYKVVFFDLFFTLVSPNYSSDETQNEYYILGFDRSIWHKAFESQSYERGIGKLKDPYTIMRNVALEINPDISDEKIILATEARIKRFRNCISDVDGSIIKSLSEIKKLNKKMVLNSNSDVIDKIGWESSKLSRYFNVAIFSCDVGFMKPDKEMYEIALKKIGAYPEDCLYVGDGGNDELKTAKALGMTTVLTTNFIQNTWPERIKIIKEHADFTVDHIEELLFL